MSQQMERIIHIIVVDDEPISADDMSYIIRQTYSEKWNIDVRTAYNAKTVLKMIDEIPCDILVSDIQMPGMNGLEMARRLREFLPDLRVIFLTGYDDFSYAYEAFRQNAVQYILKTEGDETVLNAVEKEIRSLRENDKIFACINDAESRYIQMLPAYRRQLVMQLMLNQKNSLDELETEMLSGNLYLVFAQLQGENSRQAKTKMRAATAVSEIVVRTFGSELQWTEYYVFDDTLIWVLCYDRDDLISKTLFHLMRQAREQLQKQLNLTMFFVVSEKIVDGTDLNEKYLEIQTMLANEILQGSAGVAVRYGDQETEKNFDHAKRISDMRRSLENIQILIRKGAISEAKQDMECVIDYLDQYSQTQNLMATEAAWTLNAALLSYINRNGMITLIIEAKRSDEMGSPEYFRKLLELLMRETEKRIDTAVKSIAEFTVKYINNHLNEDLSTAVLSDVTGYSSGYLSRVFRQQMNISIHDYISSERMNLAKEMLSNTNLKIYEIASNCGYENTTYFIKIFKMNTGMTPQDYKLKLGKRNN